MATTNAKICRRVIEAVEEAVKRDRDHRIRITRDYCAGEFDETVFGNPVPDFDCEDFYIRNRALWIRESGDRPLRIDGASLCPDKIGKLDLAWGYIPHDLGYEHIHDMAVDEAWMEAGWNEGSIRALWDMVLGQGIKKAGEVEGGAWKGIGGAVARIVHGAVRLFGGWYHKFMLAVLAAFVLAGCAGCTIPAGFTPGDEPPPYTVEKVKGE